MPKIISNMTLDKYYKKYGKRKSSLATYTKAEIEQGKKDLLEGHKWALIGDAYYEIPSSSIATKFKSLNTFAKVAICVFAVGAVTTAVVVPTVLVLNQSAPSKNKVEISGEVKEVLVDSYKTLKNGDLEITLKFKDVNGKSIAIDKIVIGEDKLTLNDDYVLFNNVVVIKKKVIDQHYNEKISIYPVIKEDFDPTKDFVSDNEKCDISFVKKDGDDYIYDISIKVEFEKSKMMTNEVTYVKIGDYTLTEGEEYSYRLENDLFLTLKGDVFKKHQGVIAVNAPDDYKGIDIFHPNEPMVLAPWNSDQLVIDGSIMGNISVGETIVIFYEVLDPNNFNLTAMDHGWATVYFIDTSSPNPYEITYTSNFKEKCKSYGFCCMSRGGENSVSISRILYRK